MAGHSKWANIKHRKNAQDEKRGQVFTKLIRAITSAARQSPGSQSPALRLAIQKALDVNMSMDTIDKAVARGQGINNEVAMDRIVYEGYGLEGIAYIVITLTDNRNRTVAEVRHALDKCGGSLSVEGSVAYLFSYCSWITIEKKLRDAELDSCIDYIEDLIDDQGAQTIICSLNNLSQLRTILDKANYNVLEQDTGYRALNTVNVVNEEIIFKHEKLLAILEALDDVQEVYHNLELL